MRIVWGGGSSRIFRRAFAAAGVMVSAPAINTARTLASNGFSLSVSQRLRIWSIRMVEPDGVIVMTSGCRPADIFLHDLHSPQGPTSLSGCARGSEAASGEALFGLQFKVMAVIIAAERFPTPSIPKNRRAWGSEPSLMRFFKNRTAFSCPIMVEKPGTRL